MPFDFKNKSPLDDRMRYFEDTEVLRRVKSADAKKLAFKSKDCVKQIEAATSVWAVDGKKFLFVFTHLNEEGKQKETEAEVAEDMERDYASLQPDGV